MKYLTIIVKNKRKKLGVTVDIIMMYDVIGGEDINGR